MRLTRMLGRVRESWRDLSLRLQWRPQVMTDVEIYIEDDDGDDDACVIDYLLMCI